MKKKNILIWGTGKRTKRFLSEGFFGECNIVGFIDTYKKENQFLGYPVYRLEEFIEVGNVTNVDYLVLANQYYEENIELSIRLGFNFEKLVLTYNINFGIYQKMYLRLENVSKELFRELEYSYVQQIMVEKNQYDVADDERIIGIGKYNDYLYMHDYFRFRTFEFVARNLKDIEGSVAELGVYRATFASLINEIFPDRKMYLFDSFEGFEESEAKQEIENGNCDEVFISSHRDTSLDIIKQNMPHWDQCVVCKGYFPDSIPTEAKTEKYAFVSLDVDFEETTYQGLRFFYPKLSKGGVIFLHDYYSHKLSGIRSAVSRYEEDEKVQLTKVPIADRSGTLIIVK